MTLTEVKTGVNSETGEAITGDVTVSADFEITEAAQPIAPKSEQDKPTKPTGKASTDGNGASTIAVMQSDPTQQYLVLKKGHQVTEEDWDEAKSGNGGELPFGGLTPGEEYEIVARKAETDNLYASEPVRSDVIRTPKVQQGAPAKPADDAITARTDDKTGASSITIDPTVKGDAYIVVPKGKVPTEADWAKGKTSQNGEMLTFDGFPRMARR